MIHAVLWMASALDAGSATTPRRLTPGATIEVAAGSASACYALDTTPRSRWVVNVTAPSFQPEVWVSRGALCSAVTDPQHRELARPGDAGASVSFTSPGGRYLVFVKGAPAEGAAFTLSATDAAQASEPVADPATPTPDSVPAEDAAPIAVAEAAEDPRLARMRREVAQAEERRRIAEEEQRRRAEEAEQQRQALARQRAREEQFRRQQQAERDASFGMVMGAITGAAMEVASEYARTQAETAALEARLAAEQARARQQQEEARAQRAREEAARAQSAQDQRARQAAEQEQARAQAAAQAAAQSRADAEARSRQAQASAATLSAPSGTGVGSNASGSSGGASGPAVIAMREGVVVCPTDGTRLFGEMRCYGPFQNTLSDINDAGDIALACGSSSSTPRDFGMYGRNRVWGCGYGLNPRRSGSPNIDQAERFGLTIPPRRTYRCPETTSGYCR